MKRVFDLTAAIVLLVLSAPVLIVAAVLVKLTSRGPAFYVQKRLGRFGRPFTIYKLRTMLHNCEACTGPVWALPDDPRVTPLGRFLRRNHIDELPQLWNVLRGDMSLVGPRPERPELVAWLEQSLPGYRDRHQVRPGITGLAQLHLPADICNASVRIKLRYDIHYIRIANAWWDLKILADTAGYLLGVGPRWTSPLRPQVGGSETGIEGERRAPILADPRAA